MFVPILSTFDFHFPFPLLAVVCLHFLYSLGCFSTLFIYISEIYILCYWNFRVYISYSTYNDDGTRVLSKTSVADKIWPISNLHTYCTSEKKSFGGIRHYRYNACTGKRWLNTYGFGRIFIKPTFTTPTILFDLNLTMLQPSIAKHLLISPSWVSTTRYDTSSVHVLIGITLSVYIVDLTHGSQLGNVEFL